MNKKNQDKIKTCSNCSYGKMGFSLITCERTGRKQTATDTCGAWAEKQIKLKATVNEDYYGPIQDQTCLICFFKVSMCIC
jgi:hypothetical protein